MTVLKLFGGKVIDTPADAARYFGDDVDWVLNAGSELGQSVDHLTELKEKGQTAIRNEEPPEDTDVARLIGAVFVGDGEWDEPFAQWLPTPFRQFFALTDAAVHHKWIEIAREHAHIDELTMPAFSTPTSIPYDGEDPRSAVSGLKEPVMLGVAVLHLEWYCYVLDQLQIDYDEQRFEAAKDESLQYFTGQKDSLSDETRHIQTVMFDEDVTWGQTIIEEYDIRTIVGRRMLGAAEDAVDDLRTA